MNQRFEQLEHEKRTRIIRACLREFAEKGYEHASTNEMIKQAEISKGLLFHYFGSKKRLFLYLVDQALEALLEEYRRYQLSLSTDIFERLKEIGVVKLRISLAYPQMSKLLVDAFLTAPKDIQQACQAKQEKLYAELVPAIFAEIDNSKFRPEVNPAKATEVLNLFLEALEHKYRTAYRGREQDLLSEMETVMAEYEEYLQILKYGIYEQTEA